MKGYINGYNFAEMEVERYWSPTKNTNLQELVNTAIDSGDYWAARKVDGNFILFIKDEDGNYFFRTRNEGVNGFLNKYEYVPHMHEWFDKLPNGTVFIGEAYLPSNEKSRAMTTIFGCLVEKALARQEKGEKVHYYIFDCLAYNGVNIMDYTMTKRVEHIDMLDFSNPYISKAVYYQGEELREYISYALAQGYEGVVLQRKDSSYAPGKRTARKSIKVKKEIESYIDCFLTGNYKDSTFKYTGKEIYTWEYWYSTEAEMPIFGNYYGEIGYFPITKGAFYGWAGAVEIGVYRNDEIIPIGWISNVTEEVKKGIVENTDNWRGKVVSVSCMLIEEDTKNLRHARIMEWRTDKNWKDCDGHEIFN